MAEDKRTVAAGAEPPDDGGSADASDVGNRLAKLEEQQAGLLKTLEEERRASSGKDKKITELTEEKKELQKATLSKDQLLELRQKELDEKEAAHEARMATERIELSKLRTEQLKNKVISKFDNFPGFLIDRIHGETEEEIETDVRGLLNKLVKERDKMDNYRKVTGKPRSGSGARQINMTVEGLREMTPEERKKWVYEQYSGKGRGTNAEADALLEELSQE